MKNILYIIILIFINISNSYSEIICEPTVAQSCNKKGCEKITDPDSSTIIS